MGDVLLQLTTIPVHFLDGTKSEARAEGNNAAWMCPCGDELPLIGRCYFAFGHDCHTTHDACGRNYRVFRNADKQAIRVEEY